jgi:hypothetical protein
MAKKLIEGISQKRHLGGLYGTDKVSFDFAEIMQNKNKIIDT